VVPDAVGGDPELEPHGDGELRPEDGRSDECVETAYHFAVGGSQRRTSGDVVSSTGS